VEVTVSSSEPAIVHAEIVANPKSVRLDVDSFGSMVFRLFPEEAPRPVERFETLVQSGFYNRTEGRQIIFHRVIDRFVIQAGDPTGTGTGGSTLGPFDDQFDLDLQHNRSGVLSYAKSQDDTNDSQFFVTDAPARPLDFNHSIFGQLIEGDSVRKAISLAPVNSANRPLTDIVIREASIFDDRQNGLLRLSSRQNSGSATITVTVRNALGETKSQTFVATAAPDPFNSGPFLDEFQVPSIAPGATVEIQLSSKDVEGDAVFYDSLPVGALAFQHTLDNLTGRLTVTAPQVNSGTLELLVGVRPRTSSNTLDTFDVQRLRFEIHVPPTAQNDMAATFFQRPVVINLLSNDSSSDGMLDPSSIQILTQPSQGTLRILQGGQVEYTDTSSIAQTVSFQYHVASQFGIVSQPATVTIKISSIHLNPSQRLDINADQRVDPLDVLELINNINFFGTRQLPLDRLPTEPYLDPNGDGFLSPLDALEVINAINNRFLSGEGEASRSEDQTHAHPMDVAFGQFHQDDLGDTVADQRTAYSESARARKRGRFRP
jgi:cyclophilin family peptidyl-prolyl cis-trans isomerase